MSIMHFASVVAAAAGSGPDAELDSFNPFAFSIAPSQALAGVEVTSGGLQRSLNGTWSTVRTWLLRGVNSDFEVRATLNSGSLSSGTTGSWMLLSTSRAWTCITSGVGFQTVEATITLEIRLSASPFTVLTTSTHDISAITEV